MRRIGFVVAVAVLGLAGCTSSPPSLSKSDAAKAFTSAYKSFSSSGQELLQQDQLPNATGHPEYGRPTEAQDGQIANLMDQYRQRLSSIAWPAQAAGDSGAVESALSQEAVEVRSIAGVSGTNPILGQDYKDLSSTEQKELTAENRLRAALGLPSR